MVKLEKIGKSLYKIPKEGEMRVEAFAFIDEKMAENEETMQALVQLRNVAHLPGVVGFVVALPDIHYGYGFPIGGVAATDLEEGVISPGGVGYDINCGVRAICTWFTRKEITPLLRELLTEIYHNVPAGVGSEGHFRLSSKDEAEVSQQGALWAVKNGFGEEEDLLYCENQGRLEGVDYSDVSSKARERGKNQLGTLGAGNHFLEISYVQEVYQKEAARALGIEKDQVVVLLHTGSRGFGYQICDDYLREIRKKQKFKLPDPQLASIYINDPLGIAYMSAMKAAANYAWANRQIITSYIRRSFENYFKKSFRELNMDVIYDVSHNIARVEEHTINGKKQKVCVHRKGATRSFPAGSPDLPDKYSKVGQPVLIPGDMGRASYILKGEEKSMVLSFGTSCHGAGRVLSRRQAVKQASGRDIREELDKKGIVVLSASSKTLKEEMPEAYKDVLTIVNIVEENELASKVARLVPMGVMKG